MRLRGIFHLNFRTKCTLHWLFDHFQTDWIFNPALDTEPMRQAAFQVYLHKRGALERTDESS